MKNIYAYTGKSPAIGYVGYISVNSKEAGGIEFSIRGEGENPQLGLIVLTPEQCEALATDLLTHLHGESSAQAESQPAQPRIEPNNDEVICPSCCTQFRAIPVNVQNLLIDAGVEPPFTHSEQPLELNDAEIKKAVDPLFSSGMRDDDFNLSLPEYRAVLAAANKILIDRTVVGQARILCEWINETPHSRGSVNGQAAQVLYSLQAALANAEKPAPSTAEDAEWLQSGSLLYRLTYDRHPQNCDEINVTMSNGSRSDDVRAAKASALLTLLQSTAQPVVELTDEQRKAAAICLSANKVSVSMVQRQLRIGYNAAQELCQSIIDAGLVPGLTIAPSLTAAHGIGGKP